MALDPPPTGTASATGLLARVLEVYERGLYLQAFRMSAPLGPLAGWGGAEGMILAGRIANQLGNEHLAERLHLKARRLFPESGEAFIWGTRVAINRLGPWRARPLLEQGGPPGTRREELLALQGRAAIQLRDFDEGERLLGEAVSLAPDDPWIALQPGFLRSAADDHLGALEVAERSLALRPWFPPAADFRAHELVLLGREDQAQAFLDEVIGRTESAHSCAMLLQLQIDRGLHPEAEATLERLAERTPVRSRGFDAWLESRRSDVAYHLGDRARAAAHARRSRSPFYQALAGRLETAQGARRSILPVPFVRQHHMTCAPATLSAVCAFHRVEAAHLEIAEAICYDGTPEPAERRWAEDRGFRAREFTVGWEPALALLDRGLPFTLSMVEPGFAHLVAVVGYDEARGVLLLRDPTFPALTEITQGWLEEHRSSGPRGMALAPPTAPGALEGIGLPEADLHDLYHQVQAALVAHDRPAAVTRATELTERAPGHRLALQAERSLAAYDGSEEGRLAATEALLQAFPDDVNLRLSRQGSLASLGKRQARIEYLRAEHARCPHPLLSQVLGEALQDDARDLVESLALARWAVRHRAFDGHSYHLLGDALWSRGARDESALAYRFAACLDPTNEHFAETYFRATRFLGRTEEALRFLRGRFERYAGRSGLPAETLVDALEALERRAESLSVLDRAVERRPEDGPLLLYAARTFALAGQAERSSALLQRARGPAHQLDILRTEALLEELRGNLSAAAALRVRVAELDPLHVAGVEAAARLLAETEGREAAVALLRRHVDRFPHHQGLGRALIGWMGMEAPGREAELRRLAEAVPTDSWARRELALHLSRHRRLDEAFAVLAEAEAIDPAAPALKNVRSSLLVEAGCPEEARASLRDSLRMDVDQDWAIDRLLELADDGAARRAELAFVLGELVRQVTFGDGLLTYQRSGAGVLPPEDLLATLREAHAARPDLWHAWVALGAQLRHLERTEEALSLLEAAAERFPLLPRIQLELGALHRARGDAAGWRRALERAVQLSPTWREATFKLAEVLEGAGEFEASRALLARALRHAPSDGFLHGWLAEALLALGRTDEGLEELQRALRLEPSYPWALATLREKGEELGRPALLPALAEELVASRPLDVRAWILAARAREDLDARLEASARALALGPADPEVVELRVELLADAGRFDEAVAAVSARPWGGPPPRALRLALARIEARRGRDRAAREALDVLLEAEPDYLEAWELAADWHLEAGRFPDCLRAARQLVRLAPHRSVSVGWLALALLRSGERRAAKEALGRAVQLDPMYLWAIRTLFEARMEDREVDAAAELLAPMERQFEPAELQRRRLEVALARRDRPGALASFEALLRLDDAEQAEAATALLAARFPESVGPLVSARLVDPQGTRAAGCAWVVWAGRALSRPSADRRLFEALAAAGSALPGPALLAALEKWFEKLADWGARRRLRRWAQRQGTELGADLRIWGTVGYALARTGQHARTVAWLAGWREREGRPPWIALNLAYSLCHLHRMAEAAALCREALALPPDHSRALHQAIVAGEAALRGELGPEGSFPPEGAKLDPMYACLAALARALRAGLAGPPGPAGWRGALPHLSAAAAASSLPGSPAFLRRAWLRALLRLARHLGTSSAARAWWTLRGLAVAIRAP